MVTVVAHWSPVLVPVPFMWVSSVSVALLDALKDILQPTPELQHTEAGSVRMPEFKNKNQKKNRLKRLMTRLLYVYLVK
jgi:hypothetical protein